LASADRADDRHDGTGCRRTPRRSCGTPRTCNGERTAGTPSAYPAPRRAARDHRTRPRAARSFDVARRRERGRESASTGRRHTAKTAYAEGQPLPETLVAAWVDPARWASTRPRAPCRCWCAWAMRPSRPDPHRDARWTRCCGPEIAPARAGRFQPRPRAGAPENVGRPGVFLRARAWGGDRQSAIPVARPTRSDVATGPRWASPPGGQGIARACDTDCDA
jgi:hypothetical protein